MVTQRGADPLTILVFMSKLQGLFAMTTPPRHSPLAVALRPSMIGISNGLPVSRRTYKRRLKVITDSTNFLLYRPTTLFQ